MNRIKGCIAGALLAALGGCYTVTPLPSPPPPTAAPPAPEPVIRERVVETRVPSETDALLAYYTQLTALPREQQGKELERVRRVYEASGASFSRMQLAIARLAVNGELKEHDKALELLQLQLSSKDDSSTGLRALAGLLRQLLIENRQLEGNLEAQRERLRDETKKTEALRQKLDALVEAERKLQERNRPK